MYSIIFSAAGSQKSLSYNHNFLENSHLLTIQWKIRFICHRTCQNSVKMLFELSRNIMRERGENMAFGIKREELQLWKEKVKRGEIAFITHYWLDDRFPGMKTVTKVGCADIERLIQWGEKYGIPSRFIDKRSDYPHFDLLGDRQVEILKKENLLDQLKRFEK
jgi:hypothetical protein